MRYSPPIGSFLSFIEENRGRFSLKWDTEYDESIEDSIWRNFTLEESHVVVEAIRVIKDFSVTARKESK